MELRYSKNGVPYIYFDDDSYLVFSVSTETFKGFNALCFDGHVTKKIKAKSGKKIEFTERVMFSTTFKLGKIPRNVTSGTELSRITVTTLKKIFDRLTVDGYFPRSNLEEFDKELQSLAPSADDFIDDDETIKHEEDWENV